MLEELYKNLENIINGTDVQKISRQNVLYQKFICSQTGDVVNIPVAYSAERRRFEVPKDNEILTTDSKEYKIPNGYNRELIALSDDKTLQMILIYYGFDYRDFYDTS